jgi:hypothetical protein
VETGNVALCTLITLNVHEPCVACAETTQNTDLVTCQTLLVVTDVLADKNTTASGSKRVNLQCTQWSKEDAVTESLDTHISYNIHYQDSVVFIFDLTVVHRCHQYMYMTSLYRRVTVALKKAR